MIYTFQNDISIDNTWGFDNVDTHSPAMSLYTFLHWLIRGFVLLYLCDTVLGGDWLEGSIYLHSVSDHWCIQVLNSSTSLGCSSPDRGRGLVGALWNVHDTTSLDTLPDDTLYNYTLVVQQQHVGGLVQHVTPPSRYKGRVSSILVGCNDASSEYIATWNWDTTRSLSKFQRGEAMRSHDWNPQGLDIPVLDIPMALLSPNMTLLTANRSLFNEERYRKGSGPLFVSRVKHHMLAEAPTNSTACLHEKTCLPVGGFSVLSGAGPQGVLTILVISRVDNFEFFHGIRTAYDGPDSRPGLCTMLLAASKILSGNLSSALKKRVVFAALQSESMDFMGGRRLVYEIDSNNRFVSSTLDMSDVEAVIDVSGLDLGGATTLYAHRNPNERDNGTVSGAIMAQLRKSLSMHGSVVLHDAQSDKAGLPPTSGRLFGFLYPTLPVLSLTEYNSEYIHGKGLRRATKKDQIRIITSTASSLAETLIYLLTGKHADVQVSSNETERLMACLSSDAAFLLLECDIIQEIPFGGPFDTSQMRSGYPGIVRFMTEDSAIVMYDHLQSSLERFVWNYMVPLSGGKACNARNASSCPDGTSCGGRMPRKSKEWAVCVAHPPIFVPAFSYYMSYSHDEGWSVNSSRGRSWEASFQMPPDPMLVESNWVTGEPSLTVYMTEDSSTNSILFFMGVFTTVIAAVLSFFFLHTMFNK